uniref:Phosphorylase b kinase regulatory subunit n=1 Tax=Romanomermis culicivorax TaxID=13658 RepID=A0A915KTL6_ROMCU
MQIKQDQMDIHHKLEYYTRLVYRTILDTMDPVTGLFASTLTNMTDHAWVRDNVYAVHAIWGLSLAYHKRTELEEDRRKAYELDQ